MRRIGRGLIVGMVTTFAMTGLLVWPARGAGEPDHGAAATLLVMMNADRVAAGIAPLVPSVPATTIAEGWSQHMVDIGDLAHNDEWFTAESKRRLGAGAVAENVATNVDLADAHRRLMASPGHRANILDDRFHQVGIGVVRGPSGAFWITEDFLQVKDIPAAAAATVTPQPAPAPPPPPPAPATAARPAAAPPVAPPPAPVTPPPPAADPAPAPAAVASPVAGDSERQPDQPRRVGHAVTDDEIGRPGELAAPWGGVLPVPDRPGRAVPFVLVLGAAALLLRNSLRLRHLRR